MEYVHYFWGLIIIDVPLARGGLGWYDRRGDAARRLAWRRCPCCVGQGHQRRPSLAAAVDTISYQWPGSSKSHLAISDIASSTTATACDNAQQHHCNKR
jgi:hypothetical protein